MRLTRQALAFMLLVSGNNASAQMPEQPDLTRNPLAEADALLRKMGDAAAARRDAMTIPGIDTSPAAVSAATKAICGTTIACATNFRAGLEGTLYYYDGLSERDRIAFVAALRRSADRDGHINWARWGGTSNLSDPKWSGPVRGGRAPSASTTTTCSVRSNSFGASSSCTTLRN